MQAISYITYPDRFRSCLWRNCFGKRNTWKPRICHSYCRCKLQNNRSAVKQLNFTSPVSFVESQ